MKLGTFVNADAYKDPPQDKLYNWVTPEALLIGNDLIYVAARYSPPLVNTVVRQHFDVIRESLSGERDILYTTELDACVLAEGLTMFGPRILVGGKLGVLLFRLPMVSAEEACGPGVQPSGQRMILLDFDGLSRFPIIQTGDVLGSGPIPKGSLNFYNGRTVTDNGTFMFQAGLQLIVARPHWMQ